MVVRTVLQGADRGRFSAVVGLLHAVLRTVGSALVRVR